MSRIDHNDELNALRSRYASKYRLNWRDYQYRWHPRHQQSVYYRQGQERALVDLFNEAGAHLDTLRILDVGCGSGGLMRFLVSLGADPTCMVGCDLLDSRLEQAQRMNPGLSYLSSDAARLPFRAATFDMVSQFTVFSSVSPTMQREIAGEMIRVLKPGGGILWYDMRGPLPSGPLQGIERDDLLALFPGCELQALRALHAALSPRLLPHGRLWAELADTLPWLRRSHYLALLMRPKQ
jgi:ubiquinone/menaquinone biosynthesis C-methylase UbiE